jgi:RNase P subunit RPR2
VEWATALKQAGILPNYEATIPVTPYTGQICDKCFSVTGKLKRSRMKDIPYNKFKCLDCGTEGDRHQVSARVSALLLKQHVEAESYSLS